MSDPANISEAAEPPVDAPEPISTLAECHRAGYQYAALACSPLSTNDPGLMWATLAVASELRALRFVLESRS